MKSRRYVAIKVTRGVGRDLGVVVFESQIALAEAGQRQISMEQLVKFSQDDEWGRLVDLLEAQIMTMTGTADR
jgi:hypothetical protein